ncbi:GNAT family N-acetyltransferase [Novosphingobium sp.]|uniref:GNAT family N-acetyltransferase n=1 Tax=Novosphingobium sp. TaxID=1874826 RepID=UPI0025E089C7|nr:GNAT family N-acetyltransferase [Novosphingobium sp.]
MNLVNVAYHDDLKEVQGDAALMALLSPGPDSTPFDRLEWWRLLVEEADILPLIAVAQAGKARAVLPLTRKARRVEGLVNWYSFRLAPLVTPGADAATLIGALATDLAGQSPHIMLFPLPDENGEATLLQTAFRQAGWAVFREPCDENHVLPVNGRSFADYLAARPGPLRTTLKRKASKVAVSIETRFNPDSWAAYEAIYAQSWKPEEGSPAFLRRFAEAEGAAGRLRLGLARADGVPVAAQFWTVEGGTAFIHKLAHTEASKPLSPGTTLSAALFEHVIDVDRVNLVDFGTGTDGYKRDWMEAMRPRYRLEMLRPGWPGNWPRLARLLAKRLVSRQTPA